MSRLSIETLYGLFLQYPVISTDTRTIRSGSIFFSLKGEHFNGNIYATEALKQGAAFAIVDEEKYATEENILLVQNVLSTLQQLARHHRRQLGKKGLRVFALTGSNGKTTTKELIARVLQKKYRTHFTQGNLNNHIGVPLTLLQLDESHEIAVIEMGANHQGEIAMLCEIAEPGYGLVTNIGLAHLEGFGGPEGVLKAKTELFDYLLSHNGTAFVFADDERLLQRSEKNKRITYGTKGNTEINGKLLAADPYIAFKWETKTSAWQNVKTQIAGAYNLPNLIAAAAVGNFFGVPPDEIGEALSSWSPSNQRSQVEKRGSNTLILDYYNANPSSMDAALDGITKMPGEKLLILGDMFELGEFAAPEHQKIVDIIQEKLPGAETVLVGPLFAATNSPATIMKFPDAATAAEWMQKNVPENKIILLKGSRGMKMERVAEVL